MSENEAQAGDDEVGICHVCGRTFPTQVALSRHLMDEHPDDLLPDADAGQSEDDVIAEG